MILLLQNFLILNLVLAVFNLIPIPPLDGSRIVIGLLPKNLAYPYIQLERFGFLIIFIMIYLGLFNLIIWPIVSLIANILL